MTTSIDRAAQAFAITFYKPGNVNAAHAIFSALAAIREPTPEMIEAGAKKITGNDQRECAEAVWCAMHDEMMNEKEPVTK